MNMLTISLYLNVFLIGIIAGHIVPMILQRQKPKRRVTPRRRPQTRS